MILDQNGNQIRTHDQTIPSVSFGEIGFADPRKLGTAGTTFAYNPSELIGAQGLNTFDKMSRDDQVKAALNFKQHAVTATGWAVNSPEGQEDDWEPKVFVEKCLRNVEGTLERLIKDVLSALRYGYSATEKIWDVNDDGMIILKTLKTRRPHEIDFKVDVHGNLLGIRQAGRELSPLDKFIVYTHDMEFGNWYGVSDLEAAHRAWWLKRNAYQWMAMLLERLGIPPIFAMYNPNAYPKDKLADFKSLLRNIQAATVGIIPRPEADDVEMWTTEIKGGIEQVFIPALDRCDKDIAKALLMPGLLGMTSDDKEGSFARAQVHFDVFILVIERIRTEVAKFVINEHIVQPLCKLNFGLLDEYPCFEFNPLTDEVRVDLLESWNAMTGSGVVTPQVEDERHVRSLLKFPELSPEAEKRREEQTEIGMETERTTLDQLQNPPEADAKPPTKLAQLAQDDRRKYFAQIEDALDELEERAEGALRSALEASRDALVSLVRRDFDIRTSGIRWVNNLELRKFGAFQQELMDLMREATELGNSMVSEEVTIKTNASAITVTPRKAVKAMADKAFWVTGVVRDRLTRAAQSVLVAAIKNGEALDETVRKLGAIFEPYLGDPNTISDGKVVEPYRLKTIVRTNTTDAYNTGRLASIRDPKKRQWIRAVRYSAVIDERTTEICSELHGLLFKVDDEMLDRLTPPNHYNCRSLLTPVMIDTKVNEEDYATREQVGRALDLMPTDFGGSE